jgi:catechol 2,3-dioxygenase-like lactoylglutathione lyase family enzyme
MSIIIDHITIAARDKEASMEWMARILGVAAGPVAEPFAIVELEESTLDYFDSEHAEIQMQHVAFRVSNDEFDAIHRRVTEAGIDYYAHPQNPVDPAKGHIYFQENGGRGFYVKDPDGHMMEIKTARDDPRRVGGYDTGPFRPAAKS